MPLSRFSCTEELYRTLFETAPDAMLVVTRDGGIVLANPQAHRLFGYPLPDGLHGRVIEELLPAGLRAAHASHRDHYMDHPRVRPMGSGYELTGQRRDGGEFPIEIALSPIGHDLFAASVRDISETHRVRQALQRSRYDAYQARLGKLLVESGQDESARAVVPALIAEALGVEAVAIAVGLPDGEAMPIRVAHGMPPALQDALPRAWARDRLAARLDEIHASGIWTLSRSPADELPATRETLVAHGFHDMAIVPIFDRHTVTGLLLAMSRESNNCDNDKATFLRLSANILAAAVQRSRSEAQLAHIHRLDALGQLTGGIVHDFNNLLTIVSGNLQMLQTRPDDGDDAHAMIESALRAVDLGAALTRKLLGFSRRRALVPRPLQPQRMLDEMGDMLGRTLGERVQLSVSYSTELPPVLADAVELETALVNLAINARDAMPDGGKLRITARERRVGPQDAHGLAAGDYVAFTVADTGIGMSRDVLKQAMDPFFTTKDAGRGSGLGLSMVYGFVRQSGGRVRIESMPGQGTRVELLLPVSTMATPDAAEVRPAPVRTDPTAPLRVLLVESEPGARALVAGRLRALGYEPVEAADEAQALARLRDDPSIALLFSDVVLGHAPSGFELVRAARRSHPALPALLTSGYAYACAGVEASEREGIRLLCKPYREDELASALTAALADAPR